VLRLICDVTVAGVLGLAGFAYALIDF